MLKLQRLRRWLLLLAVVASLPLAAVFGVALNTLLNQQAAQTERAALDLTRALATAIDNELRLSISALQVLALSEALHVGQPEGGEAARRLMEGVLASRPEWRAVVLSRPTGDVVLAAGAGGGGGPARTVEADSLTQLFRTGVPTIGTLAAGPAGNLALPMRVPVLRDGQVRYALSAVLRPEAVLSVVRRQNVPADWVVAVFDSRLNRIARSRAPESGPAGPSDSLRALIATLGARPQVFGPTTTIEGNPVHTAVARLQTADWIVALGVPTSTTTSAVHESALAYGVGILLSVCIGGLALVSVARQIERPIQDLTEAAVALGQGEAVAGVTSHVAELNAMSDALVIAGHQRARSAADREALLAAERTAREAAEEAQRRMQLLVAASARLSESLEESATLAVIASLIVPGLADACRIDLLDRDNVLQRKITYHVDPERRDAIERFVRRAEASADIPGTFPWAIRTGRIFQTEFASPDDAPFDDPGVREFVRIVGIRSVIVVPLRAHGQIIGAMAVMQAESGRRLSAEDGALINELAQRAALALDNVRLLAESRAALRDASIANRAKDEFLAMLGHELRNPLAPIVSSLELMARRGGLDLRERSIIERQVRHLSRLVDDLLDVSRIASGKVELRREVVDLHAVVARALELTQPAMEGRLAPRVLGNVGPLLVDADPTRLAQVLCNLLTNAAKFSDPSQPITVELSRTGQTVRVLVRDEGIGILHDERAAIFDRFAQSPRSAARSRGGLGLGLAIARNLVELHGGTIRVESAGPGAGSSFIIELPSPPTLVAAGIRGPADPPGNAQRRVLVVDDNTDAAESMALLLTMLGHEVRTAADGATALQVLHGFDAEVALVDIGLPDMTGYEVAARIRAEPRRRSMGLVALTGYGQASDRQRALAAGFDDHLVKPAELDQIVQKLATLGTRPRG